jgi:hypothetical protein
VVQFLTATDTCERFLWRLVRFGLVANRTQAITWIATRGVTVQKLAEQKSERLIDDLSRGA